MYIHVHRHIECTIQKQNRRKKQDMYEHVHITILISPTVPNRLLATLDMLYLAINKLLIYIQDLHVHVAKEVHSVHFCHWKKICNKATNL